MFSDRRVPRDIFPVPAGLLRGRLRNLAGSTAARTRPAEHDVGLP